MNKLLILKILATIPVAIIMFYPFWGATGNKTESNGVLASLGAADWFSTAAIILTFILMVALYCRSLQQCLLLIQPKCRAMNPNMVWLMFVPFYNIVEDFFIILNVTRSIEQEAKTNEYLRSMNSFGRLSGFGWCIAQVVALFPTLIGEIAGVISLVFWIIHWRFIAKVNSILIIDHPESKPA